MTGTLDLVIRFPVLVPRILLNLPAPRVLMHIKSISLCCLQYSKIARSGLNPSITIHEHLACCIFIRLQMSATNFSSFSLYSFFSFSEYTEKSASDHCSCLGICNT